MLRSISLISNIQEVFLLGCIAYWETVSSLVFEDGKRHISCFPILMCLAAFMFSPFREFYLLHGIEESAQRDPTPALALP